MASWDTMIILSDLSERFDWKNWKNLPRHFQRYHPGLQPWESTTKDICLRRHTGINSLSTIYNTQIRKGLKWFVISDETSYGKFFFILFILIIIFCYMSLFDGVLSSNQGRRRSTIQKPEHAESWLYSTLKGKLDLYRSIAGITITTLVMNFQVILRIFPRHERMETA